MHQKGRYNIKVAQKHNVVIKESKDIDVFIALNNQTQKRQGFYAHDEKYFRNMWKHLHDKIAHLFVAEYQNEILTAWIIFKYEDRIYYPYGASSDKFRNVQAPSLMLWGKRLFGAKLRDARFMIYGASKKDVGSPSLKNNLDQSLSLLLVHTI